jgi:hypothetical protein
MPLDSGVKEEAAAEEHGSGTRCVGVGGVRIWWSAHSAAAATSVELGFGGGSFGIRAAVTFGDGRGAGRALCGFGGVF